LLFPARQRSKQFALRGLIRFEHSQTPEMNNKNVSNLNELNEGERTEMDRFDQVQAISSPIPILFAIGVEIRFLHSESSSW